MSPCIPCGVAGLSQILAIRVVEYRVCAFQGVWGSVETGVLRGISAVLGTSSGLNYPTAGLHVG